jgi:hypothetical protein
VTIQEIEILNHKNNMATTQATTATVTSYELYSARSLSYREQIKVLKNARNNGGLTLNISLRGATAIDVKAELLNQANRLEVAEKKAKQEAEAVTESATETPKFAPAKEIELSSEVEFEMASEKVTEPEQIEITLERIKGLTPAQHVNLDLAKMTVKGWLAAENLLRHWAKTFSNPDGTSLGSGYDKCDVTIHFPDNRRYKTQYEISYFDTLEPRLLKQVKSDLEFVSGKRPSDITGDYFEFLETLYSNDAVNVEIVNYCLECFIYPALLSNPNKYKINEAKQPSFSYFEYDIKHYPTGCFFKVWKSSAQKCWVRTSYSPTGFSHQYGFLTPQLAIKGTITNRSTVEQKAQQHAEYLMNVDPMGIYCDMTQKNAVRLAPGTYETWRDIQDVLGKPSLPRHIARQKYGYTSEI